jgi:hypothetical protein
MLIETKTLATVLLLCHLRVSTSSHQIEMLLTSSANKGASGPSTWTSDPPVKSWNAEEVK